MNYASTIADMTSVARRIFCPAPDRHPAFRSPIISLKTLLTAAAIASLVTFGIEWTHTAAHSKADSDFKVADNCCAFRSIPARAGSLLDSPFAHGSALLFLSEPMWPYASHEGQAPTREAERSDELILGQLAKGASSDEEIVSVRLPQPRPLLDRRVLSGIAPLSSIATSPNFTVAPSSAGLSAFSTWLKNLFGQSGNDSLPPEAVGRTAVYDIERHAVYLPNGEKLEAHSGLGEWRDDIRYVTEKGRGDRKST